MFNFFRKIDSVFEKLVAWVLVGIVLAMLFLSSANIVVRWFQHNITWIDPFVRHLVFFSAFLGGVIATGRGTHIGIDIIGKYVESKGWHHLKTLISRAVMITSIAVLTWLLKASIDFTNVEMEFSKTEFWGIESGYLVMLIPIGVSLIIARFILQFILSFDKETGVSNESSDLKEVQA